MSELVVEAYANKVYNRVIRTKEAMVVALGIVLTDLLANNEASVRAGAGVLEHTEKAIPSAFAAPNIGADVMGVHNPIADKMIDIGAEAAPAAVSIGLLRAAPEKASVKELVAIGIVSQGLADASGAALAQEHALSHIEARTPDVGFSAVYTAYFSKLVFDKIGRTESDRQRRWRQAFAGIAAGALIAATSYLDKDNFMTDTVSHAAGVLTGVGFSALDRRNNGLNDDTATETLAA